MANSTRKTMRKNKANFHDGADREIGVPGDNHAKQSQFEKFEVRGLKCEVRNKANLVVGSWRAPRDSADNASRRHSERRSERAKQSQFPQSDGKGKYFVEKELW